MRATLTKLCAFIAFVQIGGEFLKNEVEGNIDNPDEVLSQNDTKRINCCVVREIIHRIEELLQKQLERGELKINSVLKPEEIVPNVRKIRQSDDTFNFNKCVLKSEMDQHKHLETEHIFAIKQELEKLKELVRLLRDQQQILNMLTDIDNKASSKSEEEEDQRTLIKLFRMLQNHLPQEAKSDSLPLTLPTQNSDDMKKVMIEINKLQQQIENANRIAEEKLKIEVARQQSHLQQLHGEIGNLKNGQALFVQLNTNKSQVDSNNNQSEIVGANLPKLPINSLLEKLKPKPLARKSDGSHDIKPLSKTSIHLNPKVRASTDDFFESLQRILDNDPIPETKELPLDFEINPNPDIEKRLLDLEKQLKISTKVQNLEKKIKQLHDAKAETKNLDDEDEDVKAQLKKLQRQLKNMNKGKVESKDLDEENILDELKDLQNAINDLRPKEDQSQAKIGNAELQVMLNKLIGVPAVPVRPVVPVIPTHSQLTPAQIQILRRVMAMKAASNQHQTGHSPGHGNIAFSAGHSGLYSGYGPGGDYGGGYGQGTYNAYETNYGHGGGYHAPNVGYGYTYSNPYGAVNGYTPAAGSKYGQYGSVAQYLFGGLHSHPNSGYDYTPYPGFGGYYATEVGGNAYNPSGYGAADYISKGGYGATPGYQATAVTYKPSKAVYLAANDGKNYSPASKGYNQGEDQFFRNYESANTPTYQSDASQPYPNTQENSYSGDPYTRQKIEELYEQIYKLQSVINNLNRPEYVQKPEDQQTIYELDRKITNLKSIVNNLAHPQTYGYGDELDQSDGYNTSPKSSGDRFKRDLNNNIQEVNNSTALNEFLQQVEDILSVINYFTNDWNQKHKEDNSIEKSREVRQISENLLNQVSKFIGTLQKSQRKVREVNEESPLARILNKLYNLAEFVDSLGEKVKRFNQTCTANGNNCEPKSTRRKRETDDSEESDDILGTLGILGSTLQGMMAEDGKDQDNKGKKEVHPPTLQHQLDDLKQQLEHKLHPGQSTRAHSNPQHRSSYNTPPVNYQPNYYSHLPTYYTIYDDDVYKDKDKHKLDKDKFVKIEVKKKSKFDKIFSKILDKIIIKVIKVIPIVLQKLIGIEIEKEIDIDSGGGYYDDGYGVQKKQNFGFLGLIPAIIFKLLSGISYFVKKLKKIPFIKTFLVPGLVAVGTAGLVIFLVWWLTGDDYYYDSHGYGGGYKDNHAYGVHYQNNYQPSYGYDNSYRSRNSINFKRNNLEDNRFQNSEPRPFTPNRNALTNPQRSTVMYNRPPVPYNYHPMVNYRNLHIATPYRLNNY